MQECLDRLALSLGGKTLMPLAIKCLPPMLANSDWRKRHAALIALAQIAEGCVKTMLQHLESLVAMCLQVLTFVPGFCQHGVLAVRSRAGASQAHKHMLPILLRKRNFGVPSVFPNQQTRIA